MTTRRPWEPQDNSASWGLGESIQICEILAYFDAKLDLGQQGLLSFYLLASVCSAAAVVEIACFEVWCQVGEACIHLVGGRSCKYAAKGFSVCAAQASGV